jgi:aminoglycoside phosphotransferase (APT) family kinase protein
MEVGRLLASGRDGSIYEFGPGLVLRKTNDGRSLANEARIMEYVAEHGYPVPAIHELRAGGSEMVMERIEGPLMLGDGVAGSLRLPRMLGILADLHDRLHRIIAPDWLPSFGEGDRLLHLDLHPLNVIMSPNGPVVIDWPNARRGDPMADVALTYALISCGRIPLPRPLAIALGAIRAPLLRRTFAQRYLGRAFYGRVAEMAELKCFDENMDAVEIRALRKLAGGAKRLAAKAPG